MRNAIAVLGLLALMSVGCGLPEDHVDTVGKSKSALFIDTAPTNPGHGPFPCYQPYVAQGAWGYADFYTGANYTGNCDRYYGSVGASSGHAGFGWWAQANYRSVKVSSSFTVLYACQNYFDENHGTSPCLGGSWYSIGAASVADFLTKGSWLPSSFVLGYFDYCPYVADYGANPLPYPHYPDNGPYPLPTTYHWCSGSYTPYDSSTLPTLVLGDGAVMPGLPYGHPVNLGDATSPHVECVVDLSITPFVPPAPTPPDPSKYVPQFAMAVYGCP